MQYQARTGRADLSGVCIDAEKRVVDGRVEIGVFEDDVGRLAAEFERNFLEIADGCAHDRTPGYRAAGERHFVDEMAFSNCSTGYRSGTGDDVDDAARKFEFLEKPGQTQRTERREFR